MKLQYISSACVVVEHNGIKVLCDPWLTDGIYYGSWYHYPPLQFQAADFGDVDAIYISHIHPDHLDPQTLKELPKDIPVILHDFEEKFVSRIIRSLGFANVIELQHGDKHQFGPDFFIQIFAADDCDPALCGVLIGCPVSPFKQSLQVDTMAVFHGGGKTIVNSNDSPYGIAHTVCRRVVQQYERIDLLLVGYAGAGPYPQCFTQYSDDETLQRALAKRDQFLHQTVDYLAHVKPKYFLPFAGQYTLGGSLAALNAFRGVPELHELRDLFHPLCKTRNVMSEMVLLNSGSWFDLSTEEQSAPFTPIDMVSKAAYVESVLAVKPLVYDKTDVAFHQDVWLGRLTNAQRRVWRRMEKVNYRSDWTILIDIGLTTSFAVPLDGEPVYSLEATDALPEPYVLVKLAPGLLDMILDRQAHWNNAEIGSHLDIRRSPDVHDRAVFYFLYYLHE